MAGGDAFVKRLKKGSRVTAVDKRSRPWPATVYAIAGEGLARRITVKWDDFGVRSNSTFTVSEFHKLAPEVSANEHLVQLATELHKIRDIVGAPGFDPESESWEALSLHGKRIRKWRVQYNAQGALGAPVHAGRRLLGGRGEREPRSDQRALPGADRATGYGLAEAKGAERSRSACRTA